MQRKILIEINAYNLILSMFSICLVIYLVTSVTVTSLASLLLLSVLTPICHEAKLFTQIFAAAAMSSPSSPSPSPPFSLSPPPPHLFLVCVGLITRSILGIKQNAILRQTFISNG